ELAQLALSNRGFSCSAVFGESSQKQDAAASDIIDPLTGTTLRRQAACFVLAPTALEAELWSTALLSMGRPRAEAYTRRLEKSIDVAWIERGDAGPAVHWLGNRNV